MLRPTNRVLSLGCLLLPLLLATQQAAGAQRTLIDDFSGSTVDFGAWSTTAALREIVDGRLILKAGSAANVGSRTRIRTRSTALSSLEGTLTVEAASVEAGSWSMVRLEGIYYNAQSAATTDYTGDVWAAIFVGERGNGLEAWWEIWESLNGGFTSDVMRDDGTLAMPGELTTGTAYRARIEYDGAETFTFTLGANVETGSGPARMGGPLDGGYQEFSTRVYAGGSIHATLDDTEADGVMTDDFSAALIDTTKWQHLEAARIVEGGALRLDVRALDLQPMTSSEVTETVSMTGNPDYFEGLVRVSASSALDPGLLGEAGLVGALYNHERDGGTDALPYDGEDGDVFGRVQLLLQDGSLIGSAQLETATDAGNTTSQELFRQDFTSPLTVGQDYLLWIRRSADTVTFGIGDEEIEHVITTPAYDPSPANSGGYRGLESAIRGSATSDPGGAGGLFKALVDDVYVGGPRKNGSGTWLSATPPLLVLLLAGAVVARRRFGP